LAEKAEHGGAGVYRVGAEGWVLSEEAGKESAVAVT
jgi:hypothetical protein